MCSGNGMRQKNNNIVVVFPSTIQTNQQQQTLKNIKNCFPWVPNSIR